MKKDNSKTRDVRDFLNPETESIYDFPCRKELENRKRILNISNKPIRSFSISACPRSWQGDKKEWYQKEIRKKLKEDEDRKVLPPKEYKKVTKNKELALSIIFLLGRTYSNTDVDNLAKNIMDGMEGVLYEDDKQICWLIVEKSEVPEDNEYRELNEKAFVAIGSLGSRL